MKQKLAISIALIAIGLWTAIYALTPNVKPHHWSGDLDWFWQAHRLDMLIPLLFAIAIVSAGIYGLLATFYRWPEDGR